jgi:hypothetical protein
MPADGWAICVQLSVFRPARLKLGALYTNPRYSAFRTMRVLENGRQICEHCGHIIFPQDYAFWCPCQKCVDVHFSLKYSRFFSTGRAGGSVRSRYGRARRSHANLSTPVANKKSQRVHSLGNLRLRIDSRLCPAASVAVTSLEEVSANVGVESLCGGHEDMAQPWTECALRRIVLPEGVCVC